ncbi:MAG: hypothetical protein ABI193_09225, partial [Minicystis sp.]
PSLVTAAGLPDYCDEVIRGATVRDPVRRYRDMPGLMQALQALRARLAGDPEAELVVMKKHWERLHPIAPVATGDAPQAEPVRIPAWGTAPPVSSPHSMVAGGVASGAPVVEESRRVVSKTVPMGAVASVVGVSGGRPGKLAATVNMVSPMVPAGMTASGVDVGAPTVRGRDQPRSRRGLLLALLIAVVLIAVGVTAWVLRGADGRPRLTEAPKAPAYPVPAA